MISIPNWSDVIKCNFMCLYKNRRNKDNDLMELEWNALNIREILLNL